MSKEYVNVIEFNNRIIGLTCADFLSKERLEWFKGVINEELQELEVANNNRIEAVGSHDDYMSECCKAEMVDALIDLLYFTYGRLYEIGVFPEDFNRMWDMVHAANMKKKKGNKGRGSNLDAIKPEGWEAPEKKFFNTSMSLEAEGELVRTTLDIASKNSNKIITKGFDINGEYHELPTKEQLNKDAWHAENVAFGLEFPYNPLNNYVKNGNGTEFRNFNPSQQIGPAICPPCKLDPNDKMTATEVLRKIGKDSNSNGLGVATGRFPCDRPNLSAPPSTGTAAGVKLDTGKNNLSLVFRGFSKSIPEVGWIGTFGATKYTPNGWQVVDNLQERYESGLLRHYMALANGEEIDPESGRQHLAHLAWNALALSQHNFNKMTPDQYKEYQAVAKKKEQEYFEKVQKERELSEQAN